MTLVLQHSLEGDHDPYRPCPWGRYPVVPDEDQVVRVGVRASRPVAGVVVEWTTTEGRGSRPLHREGEVWTGDIGPFEDTVSYRFVADSALATDWYEALVAHWEVNAFEAAAPIPGGLEGRCRQGRLRLNEVGSSGFDWSLGLEPAAGSRGSCAASGKLRASVEDGHLQVTHGNTRLVFAPPAWRFLSGVPVGCRLSWLLEPGERIFGTGERFDRLDQRGLAPDVRVYDQYKRQGSRTYFPLPWLLSTRGYGLSVHSLARVRFDLGRSIPDVADFSILEGGSTCMGRIYVGSPAEVVSEYAAEVGRPGRVPTWLYGPWMSGNAWDSDQRVREVVTRSQEEGIPATVIVIEAWSDEATFYLFNDTVHDPVSGDQPVPTSGMRHRGRWPDPRDLVEWLHDRGLKVLLWQIPVLKDTGDSPQHCADLAYAEEAGLCVRTLDGLSYRNRAWWFPNARVIDFTNPRAHEWWFSKRAYLLDEIGVDGFKTDGGEHLWGADVVTSAGEVGDIAANAYPTHYLASYHQFLARHGRARPVTFSRDGHTGAQQYPSHWAGDEDSTWEAMRASLVAGLSAGLSAISFWAWDLAGFAGPLPTAELYQRAAAFAAFCPIMQYHSEQTDPIDPPNDRSPWNVAEQTGDPDPLRTYSFYSRVRMNLIPYLASCGLQASRTGLPLMRAMALEYPDDPDATALEDQYLLGADLLVAPVLAPGVNRRSVYLPDSSWRDLWSGALYPPGWAEVNAPADRIPVFARSGAAIPLWLGEETAFGSPVGLPGHGPGHLVILLHPGTGQSRLADPITEREWVLEVAEDQEGRLRVRAVGNPSECTLWIRRGGEAETFSIHRLPHGDSELLVRADR